MVSKKVTVINESGLHARPAGMLVHIAQQCTSDITCTVEGRKINLRNILDVMKQHIPQGAVMEIQCEGSKEAEDLHTLTAAIENGFEDVIC